VTSHVQNAHIAGTKRKDAMANPNKTFAKAREKVGWSEAHMKAKEDSARSRVDGDAFMQFVFKSASDGRQFSSLEEARRCFNEDKK
jgi:hypothetical protein